MIKLFRQTFKRVSSAIILMEPRRVSFKIVIKRIEQPLSRSPAEELEWICQSLGFLEPIDREKTASAIFKEIVRSAEEGTPLNSTDIAEKVHMSRGSVINHLNNLILSGLIVKDGRYFFPRSRSVLRTIEEIEEDIARVFTKMKKTAREIDEELGIASRSDE